MMTSPLEMRPSSSSSATSSVMSSESSQSASEVCCAVCGDQVNGTRYGAPACLGCIVFFRRAVINQSQYKCWKKGCCVITFASRCVCRCCRLRKCFNVGMRPDAIQRRDLLGPRKPKNILKPEMTAEIATNFSTSSSRASSDSEIGDLCSPNLDIEGLLQLQRSQRAQHQMYSDRQIEANKCVSIRGKLHRRARANDINFILKLGLENAMEWAKQFEPFRMLSAVDRNLVLSEFGFAFVLIDMGFKTAHESEEGYWLCQNDTFMHSDYFLALPEEDAKKDNVKQKAELHFAFINELVKCVSTPFQKLQIDEFECAILKTVLLLTPSFPGQVVFQDIDHLHSKCMSELMEHSAIRAPGRGPERFGEILLLISSIRCGIKAIYNQTRVSDVFHLMTFDPFVRNIFLS